MVRPFGKAASKLASRYTPGLLPLAAAPHPPMVCVRSWPGSHSSSSLTSLIPIRFTSNEVEPKQLSLTAPSMSAMKSQSFTTTGRLPMTGAVVSDTLMVCWQLTLSPVALVAVKVRMTVYTHPSPMTSSLQSSVQGSWHSITGIPVSSGAEAPSSQETERSDGHSRTLISWHTPSRLMSPWPSNAWPLMVPSTLNQNDMPGWLFLSLAAMPTCKP